MKSDDASEAASDSSADGMAPSAPTLREWLSVREPAAPAELVARITELVGADAMENAVAPNVLIERGVSTLRSALSDRDGALDLLAADAMITYAMEAAAEHFASIEETATEAIERIARGAA